MEAKNYVFSNKKNLLRCFTTLIQYNIMNNQYSNLKTYNNPEDYIKENKNGVVLTGFRPSNPKWSTEIVGLTLWHYLQLKKITEIVTKTNNEIYCIIANVQWYSDKWNRQHADLLKLCTQRYLVDWLAWWLDHPRIKVFLESDVRWVVASLTDLIQSHLLVSDFDNYFLDWDTGDNYFMKKLLEQRNKWKAETISNIFTSTTGQIAHLMWVRATAVPSWADEMQKTNMTNSVIQRLNNEFDLWLPAMCAIWDDNMLLWLDGRQMSTNYGNYILITDSRELIEKKINSISSEVVICDLFQKLGYVIENQAWLEANKVILIDIVDWLLAPVREKAFLYGNDINKVKNFTEEWAHDYLRSTNWVIADIEQKIF